MLRYRNIIRRFVIKHVASLLIVLGVLGLILSIGHHVRAPAVSNPTSIKVSAAPSSVKLTQKSINNYSVPSDDPKYIAVPSIGITNTPIVRLGLLAGGAISTPDNIYEAGWYEGSALPGQSGATFIYGHVSSWTADGIFYNLKKLVAGNMITLTRGDGKTFRYRVISSRVYASNDVDMRTVLSPINSKLPGLNLMTCTGTVIPGTSEFTERLVVFTSLIRG